MNWTIFSAIISLSAFSAIHCLNEKTVGELQKSLAPLKHQLDQALTGYRKNKYTTFQLAAEQFELSKNILNIPESEIFNEHPFTRRAFYKLTLFHFVYPVLSDQIRLSDALKVNALGVLLRQENITLSSPEIADLKESIREIIAEEKRVDYNFNQANLILDDLYYDLHNIDVDVFPLTSGFVEYSMSTLKQYCAENSTNCPPEMTATADKITTTLTSLRKLLPINTPEKVDSVAELTSGYVQLERALSKLIEAEKIECFAVKCVRGKKQRNPIDLELRVKHDETLPELLNDVYPLKKDLETAVSGYQQHKYTVFALTADKFLFTESLKSRIARLPENSTIDDSPEAKETFSQLIVYKYLYPILADPVQLGDALKFNALINGIAKKNNESSNLESRPSLEKAKETIKKIIAEETKINHDFNQTNDLLDDLYHDLGWPNEAFLFTVHGLIKRKTDLLHDFCETDSCSSHLILILAKFEVYDRVLDAAHPIDSNEKLNKVANKLMGSYWGLKTQLEKFSNAEHIDCDLMKCFRKVEKQKS